MQLAQISSEDIYQSVREDILNLRLVPGQRVSENEIAGKYGVSRTPVKAAFLRLMSEKFIEVLPQRGTYVTLLDMAMIRDTIYMRYILEREIFRQLAESPPGALLQAAGRNLQIQKAFVEQPDDEPKRFYETDSAFHALLFAAAGRPSLWEIIQSFKVYYTRFRMLDIVAMRSFGELYGEHRALLAALERGDAPALDTLLYEHLHGNLNRLADKITTEFRDYFT